MNLFKGILCFSFIICILLLYCIKHRHEGFQDIKELPHKIVHTVSPSKQGQIPYIVYQSWNSHSVNQSMYDTVLANARNNPEFDFYIFDDNECRELIKQNFPGTVLNAFDTLKPGAFKSDLWRLCALYLTGGFYMDIKFKIIKPLNEYVDKSMYVKDLIGNNIYQGFIISTARNPNLLHGINQIVENVKNRDYGTHYLNVTGPGMFGPIVYQYSPGDINLHLHVSDGDIHQIRTNSMNDLLLEQYPNYRSDQKTNGSIHYAELWSKRNIFNE